MDPVLENVVKLCYAHIDTPRSLMCAILLRNREWAQLATLRLEPSEYLDASSYRRDAQAFGLLKKFQGFPCDDPKALSAKAKETFLECERKNAFWNQMLRTMHDNGPNTRSVHNFLDFLEEVKRKIRQVLGKPPTLELDRDCFGPGTSVGIDGAIVCVPGKLATVAMTPSAWVWLPAVSKCAWGRSLRRTLAGNVDVKVVLPRFATVPKDATTDRPIIVGPSLNVAAQKTIGNAIRRRLLNVGIDLDDGQELHQALAEQASADSAWATLDLSSASDSVCLEIVRSVLPSDWLSLMEAVRYVCMDLDGSTHFFSQFSSMGNGYTFELESLLFWAIAHTSQEFDLGSCALTHVYGDDIIVPDSAASVVSWRLEQCGFTINKKKSHTGSSPFRESCGGDFFDGHDVSIVRIKEVPSSPCDYIELFNKLVLAFPPSILDPLRRAVPKHLRLSAPHGVDGGFWDDRPLVWKWCGMTQSYAFKTVQRTFKKYELRQWGPDVHFGSVLYGMPDSFATSEDGYKTVWTQLWGLSLDS